MAHHKGRPRTTPDRHQPLTFTMDAADGRRLTFQGRVVFPAHQKRRNRYRNGVAFVADGPATETWTPEPEPCPFPPDPDLSDDWPADGMPPVELAGTLCGYITRGVPAYAPTPEQVLRAMFGDR